MAGVPLAGGVWWPGGVPVTPRDSKTRADPTAEALRRHPRGSIRERAACYECVTARAGAGRASMRS